MTRAARYLLSGALTLFCLGIAFHGADPGQLLHAAAQARYEWVIVSFVCLLLSHAARALRWRILLDPIKPAIGLRNLFSAVMIGYLLNNVLPRAGEIARPYAISRLESLPASSAFGTVVVERILDILTFLLLVAAIPLLYTGPLTETFPWLVPTGIATSGIIALALAAFVTLMVRRDWTDRLTALAGKMLPGRLGRRVAGITHAFLDGFLFLTRPRSFLRLALLSALVWVLYAVMTYASLVAFGLDRQLGPAAALVILAVSSLGVMVPTPGGTGSYHVLVTQALTALFGVSGPLALSFATVTHASGYIGITLVGAYYFWHDNFSMAEAVRAPREETT